MTERRGRTTKRRGRDWGPLPKCVVHFGNNQTGSGGIASVIRSHLKRSFPDFGVLAVTSYNQDAEHFCGKHMPYFHAVRKLVRSAEGSIVHVHLSQGGSLLREGLIIVAAFTLRIPQVVTLHGSSLSTPSRSVRLLMKPLLRLPDVVHGFSDKYQRIYDIPDNSWVCIPNDVDVPEPGTISPIVSRPKTVLFAGEVGRRKGVDVLIEAWQLIEETGWQLAIAGRISNSDPYHPEPPFPGGVKFLGNVSHRETLGLMKNARIVIQPSRAEAFPMTVCEALAHGCAVIGTDVGGMGDLLTASGQTVVELSSQTVADALRRLMDDEAALELSSRQAFAYAGRNLNRESVQSRWQSVYSNLFSQRPLARSKDL